MDKSAIRNFAIEARKILMKTAVTEAGFYGVTKDGCKDPVQRGKDFEVYETQAGTENRIFGSDIKRRRNLADAVRSNGFDQVIEETAYTWFNRIIAIRFMEVNDYLPTRVRVLSSETGSSTPDIVTQAASVDLHLTEEELEKIRQAKNDNRYDDAFRLLFVKQCNELNAILPGLFEKTDDYMELLLKLSYTGDGVVRMLIDSIPEDNFNVEKEGQVEIIGWMYQYYNTELKDDTFAKLKKNVKISKERIPAATQLFTPDWIVRYMVENSLGRVWIDHLRATGSSVDEKEKAEEFGWKYYLPEAEQEEEVARQLVEIRTSYKDLTPQDITCIDPCMGSGHILVYMFDVLMDIYRSEGYSERDAVFDILTRNIYGLDIDLRAYQLSYFALMMKGRAYGGRRFFRGKEDENGERTIVVPHVHEIEESNSVDRDHFKYLGPGMDAESKKKAMNQLNGLLDTMKDAKEYGSILNVENYDWDLLRSFLAGIDIEGQMPLDSIGAEVSRKLAMKIVSLCEILAEKYEAVVTNPPYAAMTGLNNKLSDYVKKYYPYEKSDIFAVFIEACKKRVKANCYQAMVTPQAWMFLTAFEKLRTEVLNEVQIVNLLQFGMGAFECGFGTTAFIYKKTNFNYSGYYMDLSSAKDGEEKEKVFLKKADMYVNSFEKMRELPNAVVAYWCSDKFHSIYLGLPQVKEKFNLECGIKNGNNDLFLKGWFEVLFTKVNDEESRNKSIKNMEQGRKKWFKCNKGGGYKKWYGNYEYVINLENDAQEIRRIVSPSTYRLRKKENYFWDTITWPLSGGNRYSCRYMKNDVLPDVNANIIILRGCREYCLMGYMNSKVFDSVLNMLNPTLNFPIDTVGSAPYKEVEQESIQVIVKENIQMCREDWDSSEFSWDFEEHPMVRLSKDIWDTTAIGASMQYYYGEHPKVSCPVELCFMLWQGECNERFKKLKENEEELNRIFIDIYGLQDELTPEVEDKDITVRKADLGRDIRSLISYAVGCMFGRYSLAKTGLVFAGGEFDKTLYGDFPADEDAIIPITDEPYFEDDIVKRFEEFVSLVFGADSLEANLKYIAEALGTKGKNAREKIRNYFLNDFFKDHCNTYSVTGSGKRPIYWLFDSGKQNGFKCLIYMHRYHRDTVGIIRSDYLTKVQSAIEVALKNAEYTISTSQSAVDRAGATKRRDKYVKQLAEIKAYYPALSHIALQRIEIDLDDGVKVNYAKFQGIEVGGDGEKKQKVDLLAKI